MSAPNLSFMRRSGSARHRLRLIDGPNMPNLGGGGRDPRTYGTIASLAALHGWMTEAAEGLGVRLDTVTSNHEGDLLEHVHAHMDDTDAWLINPAGLNLQSEALREALTETGRPVQELHFANVAAIGYPETVFTRSVTGMTMGLRQYGYLASMLGLVLALDDPDVLGGQT